MTYEDFKRVYEDLAEWRAERRLTTQSQKEGLVGNILEELAEVARAKNDDEKVGEICDIAVFAINALIALPNEARFNRGVIEGELKEADLVHATWLLLDDDLRVCEDGWENIYLFDLITSCFSVIRALGYYPVAAMNETLKKINSRKGAWDEQIGKWVKDTSEEAKAAWYEPNYALCKRD